MPLARLCADGAALPAAGCLGTPRAADRADGLAGLLIDQLIDLACPHPRPFMTGLRRLFPFHPIDPAFPCDALTLLWAVAFGLAMRRPPRAAGIALAALGLSCAWARVHLGANHPLDMAGAALAGWLGARLAAAAAPWYLPPTYLLALAWQRALQSPLVRRDRLRR